MSNVVLAADLGGTNIRMAAVSPDGAIFHYAKDGVPPKVTPAELIGIMERLVGACRDALPSDTAVQAMAVACPAPAALGGDGILQKLPNLPSLNGMHLKLMLTERFDVPVIVENDATAAAIGESWLGASRGVSDSIHVTLGTGVGGGLILRGEPIRGIDGTGGEIGHIVVEPDGHPCGCGSHGCVEQYASATALIRMAREAGLDLKSADAVYAAARSGNETAAVVFIKMGRYLGIMLAGLVNAFNPEMIVLGGGAAAGWNAFIEPLRKEIAYRAFDAPARRARIVRSELGDHAGILGAARSAWSAAGDE